MLMARTALLRPRARAITRALAVVPKRKLPGAYDYRWRRRRACACRDRFLCRASCQGLFAGEDAKVTAGQQVTIAIPDGASGDSIASILSENHIVENPKDYYAAVKKLNADMSLKPGTYSFTTLMDATKVVQQLMEGPNAGSDALTIPEGLTVDQIADRVAKAYDEYLQGRLPQSGKGLQLCEGL